MTVLKKKMRNLRHKFNAKPTVYDGIRFDSKKEGNYYMDLRLRIKAGEVIFFLRQVPFYLPGGGKLVLDFLEFHADGTAHFVDVKGVKTESYKFKKKQVEHLFPIEIEEV